MIKRLKPGTYLVAPLFKARQRGNDLKFVSIPLMVPCAEEPPKRYDTICQRIDEDYYEQGLEIDLSTQSDVEQEMSRDMVNDNDRANENVEQTISSEQSLSQNTAGDLQTNNNMLGTSDTKELESEKNTIINHDSEEGLNSALTRISANNGQNQSSELFNDRHESGAQISDTCEPTG